MFNKNSKKTDKIKEKIDKNRIEVTNDMASTADPTGSYTGVPTDGSTFPTQDADDL